MKVILYALILAETCQVLLGKLYRKTDKMKVSAWHESLLDTVSRGSLIQCGAHCESFSDCNGFRFEKETKKCESAKITTLFDSSISTDVEVKKWGTYIFFVCI